MRGGCGEGKGVDRGWDGSAVVGGGGWALGSGLGGGRLNFSKLTHCQTQREREKESNIRE